MYDDPFPSPIRSIGCLHHKKQKATHICTETQCYANPILCEVCFSEPKYRSAHITHENAVKPVSEALDSISSQVKSQVKPIGSLYEKTLGHRNNELLRSNLEKSDYLRDEIENRIESIKVQIELQMDLLNKQFQKQMLIEKQEFIRKLDDYRRRFFSNLETLKKQASDVMSFESCLKFYSNPNTLLLKLSTESEKKSLDWLIQQKRTLSKLSRSDSYSQGPSNLNSYIQKANEMNLMLKPVWVGLKKEVESEKEIKGWIKSNIESWVSLPDLKELSSSTSRNSVSHSGKQYRNSYSPHPTHSDSYQNKMY